MKLTEHLVAGRDAVADDESPGTMPEVKREPTEDDEKPDYMRNMIFAPKEPPKLRRSSVNNKVRPCMVHLYSHRRLRKELEDRGLNAVGSRADCTDRLLCFLSGQPQPNPLTYRETAVITIPHADENLLVPAAELFRHGVCQIAVFKNIASDIIDFLRSQMDEDSIPDSGLPSLPTPLVILNSSARVLAARAHFNEVLKKARFPETVRPKLQPKIMPRPCPIAQRKDYLESADGRTPYPTFDIRPPYRIVLKTMRGGAFPRSSNRSRVNTNLPQACSVSFTAPTPPPVPPHRYLVWPPIQRPRPVSSSISLSDVPQPHYENSNDPADISIM